jgi:o-succinylbenzoate synthase
MFRVSWQKYELNFTEPRETSRGWFNVKPSWYLLGRDETTDHPIIGECGLLPGLSFDDKPAYESTLNELVNSLNAQEELPDLRDWPSIEFGLEMFLAHKESKSLAEIYPGNFSKGKDIQINGLIWMGPKENMLSQIRAKLESGFRCIKLKIGAINFDDELYLLESIRKEFGPEQVTLRVDANGAFSPDDALEKLKRLADLQLHSIEQPIASRQWKEMAELCRISPLPIALDEELIGVHSFQSKKELIDSIKPQAIVLKPSLLGGFRRTNEWIELAENKGIEWWITSALESDIGLNAIAQFTSSFENELPQGLGTGSLYTNNFQSPLEVRGEYLHYNPANPWKIPF